MAGPPLPRKVSAAVPVTLADAHYKWTKSFTGIDAAPPAADAALGAQAAGGATRIVQSVKEMDEDLEDELDGTPPVPMALDELTPKEKAAQDKAHREQAAREKAQKARDDALLYDPKFFSAAATRVEAHGLNYKIMISGAADAFAKYANNKVSEFSREFAAADVFGDLLADVVGLIGGKLGAEVGKALSAAGGKLADEVWKKVQGALTQHFQDEVKKKFGTLKPGVEGLTAAVAEIQAGANAAADKMNESLQKGLYKRLNDIATYMQASGKVTDADAPLVDDLKGDLDAALERFGVPSPDTAQTLKAQALAKMIKSFEKKLIVARHIALGLDAGDIDDREVDDNAQKHTDAAMQEIGQETEQAASRKDD
jgi:hypothetical protein